MDLTHEHTVSHVCASLKCDVMTLVLKLHPEFLLWLQLKILFALFFWIRRHLEAKSETESLELLRACAYVCDHILALVELVELVCFGFLVNLFEVT